MAKTYRKPRVIDGRTIPFVPIEWAYWDDGHVARMRPPAWAVLGYLLRCATSANECDATASEIAERTGLSRQGVLAARDRLVELGYLQILERGGGRSRGTVYVILPLQTVPKAPTALTVSGEPDRPKVSTTLTESEAKVSTSFTPTVNDVDTLRQPGLQFSPPPLVPPNKDLQKQTAAEEIAAADSAAPSEDPLSLLTGAGVELDTARRLVAGRGVNAREAVETAIRNADILAARGELRSTRAAYIVRAVERCYAPLPEAPAIEPAEQRAQRQRAEAIAMRAEARRRDAEEAQRLRAELEALEAREDLPQLVEQARAILRDTAGIEPKGDVRSSPWLRGKVLELTKG